jgi:hypothetical protein
MFTAESSMAQPAALRSDGSQADPMDAAQAGVARVLGIDPATLRADTPLASLGWDSLARLCWADALAEDGWRSPADDVARAATIADLAGCLTRDERTR